MFGRLEVSWTIAGWRRVVSRAAAAAAAAESAFCRAAAASVASESNWRCVRMRSIGTRVESGSSTSCTWLVSSDFVGSSAWVNSTRTDTESTQVAVRGRGGTVSCGKANSATLVLESSVTSTESYASRRPRRRSLFSSAVAYTM
jgi:hypothetical protein